MMGWLVAVGIINMAETRASSKWMCPVKVLLVSGKFKDFGAF